MKKKAIVSLLCAGILVAGTITGMTGFAEDASEQIGSGTIVLSSEDVGRTEESTESTEVSTGGAITGVTDVAKAMMPAAVSITNRSVQEVMDYYSMFDFYGFGYGGGQPRTMERESVSAGSGIIIAESDTELLICTNYHVVEGATELTVGFVDDNVAEAVIKGTDESNDLAVVAVALENIPGETLDAIRIAQIGSSDDLEVGEQVVAIGNALGYGQSVTTGIVSALNRTIDLDGYTAALIQTDAAINFGNSGGALVDMQGRVIGINSAKAASSGVEGMGYAIPISYAEPILEELINKKTRTEVVDESESAYIGITGEGVTSDLSQLYGIPQGIYVTSVGEGSPADLAGLMKGDIITKFDGSGVTSMDGLRKMLAYYAAGETVKITIQQAQNGEYVEQQLEITLGAAVDYQ